MINIQVAFLTMRSGVGRPGIYVKFKRNVTLQHPGTHLVSGGNKDTGGIKYYVLWRDAQRTKNRPEANAETASQKAAK